MTKNSSIDFYEFFQNETYDITIENSNANEEFSVIEILIES